MPILNQQTCHWVPCPGSSVPSSRKPYFRQPEIEDAMLEFLRAMSVPDGLAEAVDAAIASYADQTRKTTRQSRRRSIDERLKRLGELFELGDIPKGEYLSKRDDLQMERDQLEVQPVAASLAVQRQRIQSTVDDWAVMTDEEKSRLLQLIFQGDRS